MGTVLNEADLVVEYVMVVDSGDIPAAFGLVASPLFVVYSFSCSLVAYLQT